MFSRVCDGVCWPSAWKVGGRKRGESVARRGTQTRREAGPACTATSCSLLRRVALESCPNTTMAHVAANAAVAGVAAHRPPALYISFSSTGHSRHGSFSSSASSHSDDEPSALSALDSSAALILVHDQEEQDDSFDFSDDEGDFNDNEDTISPLFDVRKSVVFPPLPPTIVFLYLLVPYLKLGALELPNSELPLKYGLPALLFSALASAFARQIWYMLARYLRKADMTDILIESFAKGRGKERQRAVIRFTVRSGTGAISSMLAIIYLRRESRRIAGVPHF